MDFSPNAKRFSGTEYLEIYDRYRPEPPAILLKQAINYAGGTRPHLVVDLGCGTGISTLAWRGLADRILGIEPSDGMLAVARRKISRQEDQVEFLSAFSDQLPLVGESVDTLSCSQSFHWMEPERTLNEVRRVLRPGGVLMVYDCTWPPTMAWPLEQAYRKLFHRVAKLSAETANSGATFFPKEQHLENIHRSGHFSFVKKAYYHHEVAGGVDRLVGIARSQGGLEALFKLGYTEDETGWTEFLDQVEAFAGDREGILTFHYVAIFAIKSRE